MRATHKAGWLAISLVMLEEGRHVFWINWASFLGLVFNSQDPMHQKILPAHVIFCETDLGHDLQ